MLFQNPLAGTGPVCIVPAPMIRPSIIPLLASAAIVLAGCDDKKKEEVKPAAQPPATSGAAASPASSALDDAKKTGAAIADQATTKAKEVAEQAKTVAADVTEKAKTAGAEIATKAEAAGEQIKASAKDLEARSKAAIDAFKNKPAGTAGLAAESADVSTAAGQQTIVTQLADSAKALAGNAAVTSPVKEQLTKLADSVLGNKDGEAAAALNQIVALKPTDDQMAVVKEIQTNFGVLALGRNFDQNDPATGGAVKATIDAIKTQNVAGAISGLQKIGTSAKLTDAQKQIAGNLVASYGGALAGVNDTVNKATDTVNKAAGALKGFGF